MSDPMSQATGPQHLGFAPFVGKFKSEVKLWMGPGDPILSTGTMVNEMALGGRFLKQEYKGDPHDGPFPSFEGYGFFGYNTSANRYEGFWVDNAGTAMQNESGSLDESGKIWTMEGQMVDPQGQAMTKRSVITVLSDDHHKLEMFFVRDGNEFKAMEIDYQRTS